MWVLRVDEPAQSSDGLDEKPPGVGGMHSVFVLVWFAKKLIDALCSRCDVRPMCLAAVVTARDLRVIFMRSVNCKSGIESRSTAQQLKPVWCYSESVRFRGVRVMLRLPKDVCEAFGGACCLHVNREDEKFGAGVYERDAS